MVLSGAVAAALMAIAASPAWTQEKAAPTSPPQSATPAPTATGPRYDDLLAQAKRDGAVVDFKALRYAYADSEHYNPYDAKESELRTSMVKAYRDKDCATAMQHAQAILDKNYVDIDAHMMLDLCYRRLEQPQPAKHHERMAHGLAESIVATGDGRTPQTAFVVIAVREEYNVIAMLGLKQLQQALIRADGHSYDRFSVKTESGGTDTIFFNIDRPLTWLAQKTTKR
jgi:hypothetical protein